MTDQTEAPPLVDFVMRDLAPFDEYARLGTWLYVLVCDSYNGRTFVKVGISDMPFERVHSLTSGCPFIFDYVWICAIGRPADARRIELAVHKALGEYRTRPRGEWFDFETGNPLHAVAVDNAFRDAHRELFPRAGYRWKFLTASVIREFQVEQTASVRQRRAKPAAWR